MENIIENNKLIAEFLNWEFDDLSETFFKNIWNNK